MWQLKLLHVLLRATDLDRFEFDAIFSLLVKRFSPCGERRSEVKK
jgi:hypothetical protein